MKIALIVGHNSKSKGSYSEHLKVYEYDFFLSVTNYIKENFNNVDVLTREEQGSYSKEMQKVVDVLNSRDYDLCIELHFNAFNGSARGSEVLCYHKSTDGKKYSDIFNSTMLENKIPTRGTVEIKSSGERGGYGIVKTKHPYILIEPFFGDNKDDCSVISDANNFSEILSKFLEKIGLVKIKNNSNLEHRLNNIIKELQEIVKDFGGK